MIIGVIGSGGREHAICAKILESKKIKKLYCFPGNAGTGLIATNVDIKIDDFDKIKDFVIKNKIDYLIVGPEKPLVDGIVDFFQKHNIKIFGPEKIAAQLEGSKIFTKKLCEKYKIPTAKFGIFKKSKEANLFIKASSFPLVVKADGLAAGKGVYICENMESAANAVEEIFNGKFGIAKNILIEEFLSGEEMSYFIISDGKTFKKFQTALDHKRVQEGEKGKNTGGMGAYSPTPIINEKLSKKIQEKIINKTILALANENIIFNGFLYAGIMIKNGEPYVLEYNVRMGDPECQPILMRMKSDLFPYLIASINGELEKLPAISWKDKSSVCVVLAAKGYPESYQKNDEIFGIDEIFDDAYIFHAGTKKHEEKILTNGGRVLGVTALGDTLESAVNSAYQVVEKITWTNKYCRTDIGKKGLNFT